MFLQHTLLQIRNNLKVQDFKPIPTTINNFENNIKFKLIIAASIVISVFIFKLYGCYFVYTIRLYTLLYFYVI